MNRIRMNKEPIRWGILGVGGIANAFAEGLQKVEGAELVACGSRSSEKSARFANQWNVSRAYGSYEAVAEDPQVDVVYVATPHPFHRENSLLCLKAGKSVLCEKPFTMNALEAEDIMGCSRLHKLFLMEAMWTRFLPHMIKVKEMIQEGIIGEVRMIEADFGFRCEWNPDGRLLNPALGGGALLDVGIYPISFSFYLLGEPHEIRSEVHLGKTGVDEESSIFFGYKNGKQARLSSSIRTTTPQKAVVTGTDGVIQIHAPWWGPTARLSLVKEGVENSIPVSYEGNGYQYEAMEVGRCLREGLLESPIMPLAESLAIMKTMDAIRKEWGLVYPMEEKIIFS